MVNALGTYDRVMVSGTLITRSYVAEHGDRAGQTIRRLEVQVHEIGAVTSSTWESG
jgi:hypothetical protein